MQLFRGYRYENLSDHCRDFRSVSGVESCWIPEHCHRLYWWLNVAHVEGMQMRIYHCTVVLLDGRKLTGCVNARSRGHAVALCRAAGGPAVYEVIAEGL